MPRPMVLLGCAAIALAIVALGWLVITGLMARARLESVKAELPELRHAITAGDMMEASQLGQRIAAQAASAHALTTGPAWWTVAHIPLVGSPAQTSRVMTREVDRIGGGALPAVLRLADDLSTSYSDASGNGPSIDLTKIAEAVPALHSAATTTSAAVRAMQHSPSSWLSPVSSARQSLVDDLSQLSGELDGANRAVDIAMPMLGATGPRRYFIGFMNEAESRGLGGIPGAFAIATADHGRIRFTHFGSDTELHGVRADVHLGTQFEQEYGQDDPAGSFPNSDVSPDFRDAARIWAGMWEAKTGQRLDGAIAIDPTALSYLLRVTGPAEIPGGGLVSGSNVVALTEKDQYSLYSNTAARKAYLVRVSKAIAQRLVRGADNVEFLRAAARAGAERRLVLWTADQQTESVLAAAGWGGVLPARGGPFSGFVVVNAAGSKLDYYLDRSMSYVGRGCGAHGSAVATLRLTNSAPASGLPPYVRTRADDAPRGARPGDNRLLVTYYASASARISTVTLNGRPVTVATMPERGLVAVTVDVELPVGSSRTITVRVAGPSTDAAVQVLNQPLVRPMTVRLGGRVCGVSLF